MEYKIIRKTNDDGTVFWLLMRNEGLLLVQDDADVIVNLGTSPTKGKILTVLEQQGYSTAVNVTATDTYRALMKLWGQPHTG